MTINYNEEVKRLEAFIPGESSHFWKPKPGQYRTRALTELEVADPFEEEGKAPKPQMKINLLIDEKQVIWTIPKGISPASAYGQLCKLGQVKGGLTNVEFMIVVTSDGTKNTYTIVTL